MNTNQQPQTVSAYIQNNINMMGDYTAHIHLRNIDTDDIDAADYETPVPVLILDHSDEAQHKAICQIIGIEPDDEEPQELVLTAEQFEEVVRKVLPQYTITEFVNLNDNA